jgi:hypothetical protein
VGVPRLNKHIEHRGKDFRHPGQLVGLKKKQISNHLLKSITKYRRRLFTFCLKIIPDAPEYGGKVTLSFFIPIHKLCETLWQQKLHLT